MSVGGSGGETRESPSGWTVDTLAAAIDKQFSALRSHLDERYQTQSKALEAAFAAADKAVQAALESAEKAVGKAEAASEKRFESVNEFRAQLADQAATFLPRTEYTVGHTAVEDRIAKLEIQLERVNSRQVGSEDRVRKNFSLVGGIVGIVGIVVAVITVILTALK